MNLNYERLEPRLTTDGAAVESRSIGRILTDMGKLKAGDVSRVVDTHREKGLRFGEAARKLRLVTEADVQDALSIQFDYPYVKPGQGVLGAELVVAHSPFDPQAEAIRDLRTQLMLQWVSAEHKVLAIVSPGTKDGRSHAAANLAVAFAQLGEKTLLIDADMRSPRQHHIFGLGNGSGLAQVLSGRGGLELAERISYFESLSVLPVGAAPPNPLELLSRPAFELLLTEARRHFSIVLLDTPASMRGSDARLISARADSVLIVIRRNRTRVAELQRLCAAVAACSVQVIGTVLNDH